MTSTARKPAVERVERPDRQWIDRPGFYSVKMVKGGADVGCKVTHGPPIDPETGEPLDRSWMWTVWINDRVTYCSPAKLPSGFKIGRPITEAEYRFLIDDRAWAAQNAPYLPEADPRRSVPRDERPIPFLEA